MNENEIKKPSSMKFVIVLAVVILCCALAIFLIQKKSDSIEQKGDTETIFGNEDNISESDGQEEVTGEAATEGEVPEEPVYEIISMDAISGTTASSSLSEYDMTHSSDRLIDGTLSAAWVEGASDQGVGESVVLEFDGIYQINGLMMNAGYQKKEELYYKNSRPKDIRIQFSDGTSFTYTLEDVYGEQELLFESPVNSDYISITIQSVYAGSKYQDTVISEVYLY